MQGCFAIKNLTSTLTEHKIIVLRILKKHHESSFNGILTIRQQFKCSTKSSEIRARTVESTEEYMLRNFKMCL